MRVRTGVLPFFTASRKASTESHRWHYARGKFFSFGSRWRCPYCFGGQVTFACEDWINECRLIYEANKKPAPLQIVARTNRDNAGSEE
jgi:hypothetical protein